MNTENLQATIQTEYNNSKSHFWFFQTPFQEFLMFNILWILLLVLVVIYFFKTIILLFKRKQFGSNIYFLILFLGISILFAFGLYNQNKKTVMYISYPNGISKIRSSIEMFISDAQEANTNVVKYNKEYTYIYLKNNILLLLKQNEKESLLYTELEKLFQKYEYIPVAIIKDNNLKSLSNNDFIRIQP